MGWPRGMQRHLATLQRVSADALAVGGGDLADSLETTGELSWVTLRARWVTLRNLAG
jgi:hypothetical protein